MAWVDSEQMWRLQSQKRSLADDDSDTSSPAPDEDLFTLTTTTPHKAVRTDHKMFIPIHTPTLTARENAIVCREPPCNRNPPGFADLAAYELHVRQTHALVCLECSLHFPSERTLAIHLEERHDPFAESQRAKHAYKVFRYCGVEADGSINVMWMDVKRLLGVW